MPQQISDLLYCLNTLAESCKELPNSRNSSIDGKYWDDYYAYLKKLNHLISLYNSMSLKKIRLHRDKLLLENPPCYINSEICTYRIVDEAESHSTNGFA